MLGIRILGIRIDIRIRYWEEILSSEAGDALAPVT